LNFPLQHVIK